MKYKLTNGGTCTYVTAHEGTYRCDVNPQALYGIAISCIIDSKTHILNNGKTIGIIFRCPDVFEPIPEPENEKAIPEIEITTVTTYTVGDQTFDSYEKAKEYYDERQRALRIGQILGSFNCTPLMARVIYDNRIKLVELFDDWKQEG